MSKTILITGATDGIGLLTAGKLAAGGHTVLLHGRSAEKLEAAASQVGGASRTYRADLTANFFSAGFDAVFDVPARHPGSGSAFSAVIA